MTYEVSSDCGWTYEVFVSFTPVSGKTSVYDFGSSTLWTSIGK